jgi:hypothetical protein
MYRAIGSVAGVQAMDILITDVTEMHGGNCCVAGWEIAGARMVRPLPNGNNWPASLLAQHGVAPGITIRVVPQGVPTSVYPHRTEDMPIDSSAIETPNGTFSDWLGQTAPPVSETLNAGFGENLQWNRVWNEVRQGVHVLPGVKCSSLVAVQVKRTDLSCIELFGKLKATISDGSNSYQIAVSSRALKEAWRQGGLTAVNRALPTRTTLHVRVGLARQFENPPKCYAMLNGVL